MKKTVSLLCVMFAMLLVLAHSAIPHHHHQNLICFNPRCLTTCCDCDEHDTTAHCECNHHHHSDEECCTTLPFILTDTDKDLGNHAEDESIDIQLFTIDTDAHTLANQAVRQVQWSPPDFPLTSAVCHASVGLRAPPAC